ncbi:hypothetical protein DFJ74DRAFT_685099 [Hyaloraphidium curvatum]|nr:hypothetical protein DFJ74DRAFT_685099 [Hyaloraphidium curvatum]
MVGDGGPDYLLGGAAGESHGPPRVPPAADLAELLDGYSSCMWVLTAVHHMPTLKSRLMRLAEATNQAPEDYAALNLCPHLVRAVLWGAYIVFDRKQEAKVWGDACREGLLNWATWLGLFDDPATIKAPSAELFSFVKAGVITLTPHYLSDLAEEGVKLMGLLIAAHRLARFGSEAKDVVYLAKGDAGTGSGKPGASGQQRFSTQPCLIVARDALDLAAWIDAEERARASCQLLAFAQMTSYLQGIPCPVHSGGYETSRGFVPGFYNAAPLPCPDLLFRALPPAPESEDDVLAWYQMAPSLLTAHVPLSYGDAVSWPDLPAGSPQRKRLVKLLFGNYFQNGFSRNWVVFAGSALARVVAYRDFVKVREWRLDDPLPGGSPDKVRAREMYQSLLLQINEFFSGLPEEIQAANSAGSGLAMRAMAIEHWGQDYFFGICTSLVQWHGLAVTLHSPRDWLTAFASFPSTDDAEWMKSRSFMVALSHALVSARIVSSALSGLLRQTDAASPENPPPFPPENDGNLLGWNGCASLRNPLWPGAVLRIALPNVYCLRLLQTISIDQTLWTPDANLLRGVARELLSPDVVSRVLENIKDCIESIAMSQRGFLDSYSHLAQTIVLKVLGGVDVTRHESEMVRLLRRDKPGGVIGGGLA